MIAAGKIAAAIGIKGFVAIGMALALAVCWWGWTRAAGARDEARTALTLAEAEIALLGTQAALVETAAEERQADTAAVEQAEEDLIDAIAKVPDTQPDAVRVRLGCERLRRAGRLDAALTAEGGPCSGIEAGPAG